VPSHEANDPDQIGRALTDIWVHSLGAADAGPDDDFFDLGGDSLIALRISARAREQGILVTPAQIFTGGCLSAIIPHARRVSDASAEWPTTASAAGEPVPLTPIQRWFFGLGESRSPRWVQYIDISVDATVNIQDLRAALYRIAARHDALRLRYQPDLSAPAGWVQTCAAPSARDIVAEPAHRSSGGSLTGYSRNTLHLQAMELAAHCFDLARGPLLGAVLSSPGQDGRRDGVLLGHHLVLDAVSWQIVLDELDSLCRQPADGATSPSLGPAPSFRRWAKGLAGIAGMPETARQVPYWLGQLGGSADDKPPLPAGREDALARHHVTLGRVVVDRLAAGCRATFGASFAAVLLGAVTSVVAAWRGLDIVRLDWESHGRVNLVNGLDLARCVGWFTSMHPLAVQVDDMGDIRSAVAAASAALHAVPEEGVRFGVLDQLTRVPAVREAPRPWLGLNFLGRTTENTERMVSEDARPGAGIFGGAPMLADRRNHIVEIDAVIVRSQLHLQLTHWTSYATEIDRLATQIRGLMVAASELTPAYAATVKHAKR
jgi:hypothetical protein